jgi:Mg-chelatase subunit ChlD
MPFDPVFHRYQHVLSGTGQELSFSIRDSTYNVAQGAVIPRYEDNCGGLTVVVEEILPNDVNICDAKVISQNGQAVGLRIDASIVEQDTNMLSGTRNAFLNKEQLGVVADGKFICPDSLVCDTSRTVPISLCLVVDVSSSMLENVRYDNVMIKRIDALKRSIHRFMRRLKPGDSLCLIQFNETVRLSQNWTADTALIGIALDRLVAYGNTAFYQAVIQGCRKLATHARANKALVAITDGLDNDSTTSTSDVFREIRAANVPVFLMALGFTGTPDEVAAIDTMRQFVAAAPSGKVYQITTGKELEDVYTQIAENFAKDDCCKLYFRIPPCDRGQSKRIVRLIYADGGRIISKELEVDCALKTTSVHTDDVVAPDADVLRASPTPSDDIAAVTMAFSRAATPLMVPRCSTSTMVMSTWVSRSCPSPPLPCQPVPTSVASCRVPTSARCASSCSADHLHHHGTINHETTHHGTCRLVRRSNGPRPMSAEHNQEVLHSGSRGSDHRWSDGGVTASTG